MDVEQKYKVVLTADMIVEEMPVNLRSYEFDVSGTVKVRIMCDWFFSL